MAAGWVGGQHCRIGWSGVMQGLLFFHLGRAGWLQLQSHDLRVRPSAAAEAAASGNLGSKKSKKLNFSKFKSVLPKMSARSGLVGKNPPGPIWGHLRPFSPWTGKMQKICKICLFGGPMGPIHPVWGHVLCWDFGEACHAFCHGNAAVLP